MILLIYDLSNLFFSSIHEYCSREGETDIDENILRGMILTRINSLNKSLSKGRPYKVVIAIDSRTYWRRNIFPLYKAKRKEAREESKVDWDSIFEKWTRIVEEYKTNIPFYFIEEDGAEGDDIHAALCFKLHDEFDEIINCSSDEDIAQLMKAFKNVKQFSLKRKKMITLDSVKYDLFEHIVKGDAGDGIPNILSPESTLVDGIRQKSVRATKVDEWREKGGIRKPELFCEGDMLDRFTLNKKLVDFDEIPEDLINRIYQQYEEYNLPKRRCFDYFIKHRLTKLMEEFKT